MYYAALLAEGINGVILSEAEQTGLSLFLLERKRTETEKCFQVANKLHTELTGVTLPEPWRPPGDTTLHRTRTRTLTQKGSFGPHSRSISSAGGDREALSPSTGPLLSRPLSGAFGCRNTRVWSHAPRAGKCHGGARVCVESFRSLLPRVERKGTKSPHDRRRRRRRRSRSVEDKVGRPLIRPRPPLSLLLISPLSLSLPLTSSLSLLPTHTSLSHTSPPSQPVSLSLPAFFSLFPPCPHTCSKHDSAAWHDFSEHVSREDKSETFSLRTFLVVWGRRL